MTDPARHRHVIASDGTRLQYVCGCVNEITPAFGVLRSVAKCDAHQRERREAGELGEAYYRSNGALDADAPVRYEAELAEVLGPIPPPAVPGAVALEIGCGASPYVRMLRRAGWAYHGLDASAWACDWMRCRYGAAMTRADFAAWQPDLAPGLILCAHAIEHMEDAPAAVAKMADLLVPGGELWVIVPDDSDPLNPDHTHHFDCRALRLCVEAAGLRVLRLDARRRIERERFLYLRAIKPR